MDLANSLLYRWGPRGASSLGIYNCRKVSGTLSWSLHAEGRAFDLGVSAQGGQLLGDEVLEALLELQDPLLQRVIWWGRSYDLDAPRGRPYSGEDPHRTHLHIELAWAAAGGLTPAQISDVLGEDEVTDEQLRNAIRSVLNEGTGNGQAAWAGTSKATLATVQGLHNQVVALTELVTGLDAGA